MLGWIAGSYEYGAGPVRHTGGRKLSVEPGIRGAEG